MDLLELFCAVDDFVKTIKTNDVYKISYIKNGKNFRGGKPKMSLSEMMAILIAYHSSNFKNFKAFYFYLLAQGSQDFPQAFELFQIPRLGAVLLTSAGPLFTVQVRGRDGN